MLVAVLYQLRPFGYQDMWPVSDADCGTVLFDFQVTLLNDNSCRDKRWRQGGLTDILQFSLIGGLPLLNSLSIIIVIKGVSMLNRRITS